MISPIAVLTGTAILGGEAAGNFALQRSRLFAIRCKSVVGNPY
jgi:hypothetical protein